jgi:hypothetical protein
LLIIISINTNFQNDFSSVVEVSFFGSDNNRPPISH